jgi:hypothetical protein
MEVERGLQGRLTLRITAAGRLILVGTVPEKHRRDEPED